MITVTRGRVTVSLSSPYSLLPPKERPSGTIDDFALSLLNYPDSHWRPGRPRLRDVEGYAAAGEPWILASVAHSDLPGVVGVNSPLDANEIPLAEWPLFGPGTVTVKCRLTVTREIVSPPHAITVGLAVDGEVVKTIVRHAVFPPVDWDAVRRGIYQLPPPSMGARFSFTRVLDLAEPARVDLVNLDGAARNAKGRLTFTEAP